jgi:hypothetical protein
MREEVTNNKMLTPVAILKKGMGIRKHFNTILAHLCTGKVIKTLPEI